MPDRTVIQKVVTAAHIDCLNIYTVAGVPTLSVMYHVNDSRGNQIGNQRSVSIGLTAGQITTLQTFVTNVVLPAVNAVEET